MSSQVHRIMQQTDDLDVPILTDAINEKMPGSLSRTRDMKNPCVWMNLGPMPGRRRLGPRGNIRKGRGNQPFILCVFPLTEMLQCVRKDALDILGNACRKTQPIGAHGFLARALALSL